MKKIFLISAISLLVSACTATGPAESKGDEYDKLPKVKLSGGIFGSNNKTNSATEDELRARLEKLEKQQGTQGVPVSQAQKGNSDITAPPVSGAYSSSSNVDPQWQNSASYADWQRARKSNSSDYKEFKEYKEWLEFQKMKNKK